ncbi:hypothetical protein BH20ACT24_BH20ACT24_07150 [soil metagenome]
MKHFGRLASVGLLGLLIPPSCGGLRGDPQSAGAASECVGADCVPPLTDVAYVIEPEEHPEIGFSLLPPDDVDPVLDADGAAEIAWSEERPMGGAEASQARLGALVSDFHGVEAGSLVWIIEYPDVCVPLFGGESGEHSVCDQMNSTWSVVIDAVTGNFVVAFSDG